MVPCCLEVESQPCFGRVLQGNLEALRVELGEVQLVEVMAIYWYSKGWGAS